MTGSGSRLWGDLPTRDCSHSPSRPSGRCHLDDVVNALMLIVSLVIWWLAAVEGWLDEVEFVSHVSMLALVFSAVSGVAAAVAGVLALVPTDDLMDVEP